MKELFPVNFLRKQTKPIKKNFPKPFKQRARKNIKQDDKQLDKN